MNTRPAPRRNWASRKTAVALFIVSATIAATACGGKDDDDDPIVYDKPQILPDNSPVCLNALEIKVDDDYGQNVILRNDGRQQLVIQEARISDASRDFFSIEDIVPKTVDTKDSAILRFHYAPTAPGWDTAFLNVISNAENFPTLRIFVLALAIPSDPEAAAEFDPGPKPDEAFTNGQEACRTQN
ncbi:MAG: hypothetical protein IPK13_00915 [Deltaproteobacteria bacterium]|nr:hypothetical protein [Deltaproteobacteria bacterium]